jgi:hypothetical protein
MHANGNRWLTAQETAAQLDTTSSEVCRFSVSDGSPVSSRKIPDAPANHSGWWTPNPSAGKRSTARRNSYSELNI